MTYTGGKMPGAPMSKYEERGGKAVNVTQSGVGKGTAKNPNLGSGTGPGGKGSSGSNSAR